MPQSPILAYVDPGSGNLILQVVAAFYIGGLFYVKRAWGWVRGRRQKTPPKKDAGK